VKFSRRTPNDLTENEITRAIRRRSRPYIDLTESNPTRVGLSPSPEELSGAFARTDMSEYEPAARGIPGAREAVSSRLRHQGIPADADRIVLTSSTSEAYGFLFKLLCDPGETVLVPEPSYPLFEHLTALEGVTLETYRLLPEAHWAPDFASLQAGLSRGARAVLIVHPNNPTGSFWRRDDLAELLALAARHMAAVVSDEVFFDYPMAADAARATSAAAADSPGLTFSLGGLSKSCALPQMKLAWIHVGGRKAEEALARLDVIADAYLSVSTPVQAALSALFRVGTVAAQRVRLRIKENLASLDRALKGDPAGRVTRLPVEGGWSAVLRLPSVRSEEEFVLRLLAHGDVLVHPGWFFGFPTDGVAVVSLLPRPAAFSEGIGRLVREFLDDRSRDP
jgi:aspartate/methionine/tyrosine aminotransferase